MFIKSQYGDNLINTDISHLTLEEHGQHWFILACGHQSHRLQLGKYGSEKQARRILDTIFDNISNHVPHMSLMEEDTK